MCYFCAWGVPPKVKEIYDRAVRDLDSIDGVDGDSAMRYGPGHIVWDDFNLEREHVEYCISVCDDKSRHYGMREDAVAIVRRSLVELLELPDGTIPEVTESMNDNAEDHPPYWASGQNRE